MYDVEYREYADEFYLSCCKQADKLLNKAGIDKHHPEYSKRQTALINMFFMMVDSPANRKYCIHGNY